MENEDEEWDRRQKQTGAAGRMVVYDKDDNPRDDILLRGGQYRRITVTAVTQGGKACSAGVKAGDVLVSIDGKKDFYGKTADEVHNHLVAPVMLVFVGFVGKLHAEVRLNSDQKCCGLATQQQVLVGHSSAPVQVIDEVVFHPSAPLFLTATKQTPWEAQAKAAEKEEARAAGEGEAPTPSAMYELRNFEARNIVHHALARAKPVPPPRISQSPALPAKLFDA